jgi:hypothetical protein
MNTTTTTINTTKNVSTENGSANPVPVEVPSGNVTTRNVTTENVTTNNVTTKK